MARLMDPAFHFNGLSLLALIVGVAAVLFIPVRSRK